MERLKKSGNAPPVGRTASLALSTWLVRGTIAVVAAVIGILLARVLGPRGRGQVAFVASVNFAAIVLLNVGYENALLHQQAERGATPSQLRRMGGSVALTAGVAGLLVIALLGLLLRDSLFAGIRPVWLAIGLGPLPLALDLIYLRAIFQANGRLGLANRLGLMGALLQLLIVGGAVLSHRLNVGLALAASSLAVVVPWAALRVEGRKFGRARLKPAMVKEALAFGVKSSLGLSFLYLMYRFDFLATKVVLGVAALGLYSVATSVAELFWLITDSAALALITPQVRGTLEGALDLTARGLRILFLVLPFALLAIAGVGIVGIPLLFGSRFQASVVPMLVLLPGVALLGAVKPVTLMLIRSNRPGTMSLISALGLAVNLALLVPMARAFGINGAAAASTVAYSLVALMYLIWLKSRGVALKLLVPGRAEGRAVIRLLSPAGILGALAHLRGSSAPATVDDSAGGTI